MRTKVFIVLGILFCTFSSCKPLSDFNKNTNEWRPKEFDPTQGILLIQNVDLSKWQISRMQSFMKSKYPYKYEFVPKSYNKDSAYSDRTIYRFALVPGTKQIDAMSKSTNSTGVSNIRMNKVTVYDFNFYDRLKKKPLNRSGVFASSPFSPFKMIIKNCVKTSKKKAKLEAKKKSK